MCLVNNKVNVNRTIASKFEDNLISNYSIALTAEISRIYYAPDNRFGEKLHYPETLIIIKPLNWIIYTNNGINFFHLTSNFNGPDGCDVDTQTPAIVLTTSIKRTVTSSDYDALRRECLKINQFDLLKMFESCDQRVAVNMSDYFDDDTKEFTSISCINLLIQLQYV